jgi:hypothetical protein
MARRAPSRGCCAGRRVSDARFGGHRRWPEPAAQCRTRATGWGSDGGCTEDAARSCGIRYLSGPGGARRIAGGVISCDRFTRSRSRFAAIASLFVLAAVLRRPRAARTSSCADSDRPASESGAAAPPLRAGLPSNDRVGDGIGARSAARGGSAAEVAQQHRSPPFVIMVGGVWWVRYSPVQRVRGAATAQLSVRGCLAGPRPELGDLGDHRVRAVAAPSTP